MAENLAQELAVATEVLPIIGEDEGTYKNRVLRAMDKLEQDKFNELSPEAQEWFEECAEALDHKNPLPSLNGFETLTAQPSDVPAEPPEEPEEATAEEPAGDQPVEEPPAGTPTEPEAVEAAANGAEEPVKRRRRGGKEKSESNRKPRAAAKPKNTVPRPSRIGQGATMQIMAIVYANPRAKIEEIQVKLKDKGVNAGDAYINVVKSQFRCALTFLKQQGVIENIDL